MRISVDEARAYFAHPSQLRASMLASADDLPEVATYYANAGVCLATHWGPWHGVLMVHLAAMPWAWGATTEPVIGLMREAWAAECPERLCGWVREENRAIQALCRRVGMQIDGRLPLAQPVILYGWRP